MAEGQERNAWQPAGTVDSLILAGLLASFVLAIGAGFLRAAGRRYEPPFTPSAAAAVVAGLTGLLVAYRAVQEPGPASAVTVQSGLALALLALAARSAYRAEDEGRAWKDLPDASAPGEGAAGPRAERGARAPSIGLR